jgi:hypothetical protein
MRTLLFFLFIFPIYSFSQKYALLDKKLKLPIIYSDSITVEQIKKGFFPVKNESVDSLIANFQYIREFLEKRQRSKAKSFELHSATTIITVKRVPYAYGDRYNIDAITNVGELTAMIKLSNSEISNKENVKHVDKVLSYLKSNKEFFRETNEITPKIYNVYIITE